MRLRKLEEEAFGPVGAVVRGDVVVAWHTVETPSTYSYERDGCRCPFSPFATSHTVTTSPSYPLSSGSCLLPVTSQFVGHELVAAFAAVAAVFHDDAIIAQSCN